MLCLAHPVDMAASRQEVGTLFPSLNPGREPLDLSVISHSTTSAWPAMQEQGCGPTTCMVCQQILWTAGVAMGTPHHSSYNSKNDAHASRCAIGHLCVRLSRRRRPITARSSSASLAIYPLGCGREHFLGAVPRCPPPRLTSTDGMCPGDREQRLWDRNQIWNTSARLAEPLPPKFTPLL